MGKHVTKAVIPTAGFGTRFLPATKTVPKELFPIIDRPMLLWIVEECMQAGIMEIVLITGRGKSAIDDFFDVSYEVEDALKKAGKLDLLGSFLEIRDQIKIISVRQKQALGLGHAVWTAKPVIGSEPFAVLLGDEIMIPEPGRPSAIGELKNLFESTNLSSVAVIEVPSKEVSKYGIVEGDEQTDGIWRVRNVVEKPQPAETTSRLALPGRYVFDAEIFDYLEKTKPGKNGEIQLSDAMQELAHSKGLLAKKLTNRRYDIGDKLGFLKANIELGLSHPEIGAALKEYLLNLTGTL